MNTTHTNEPTEPNAKSMEGRLLETISLRDYFAAQAMQSLILEVADWKYMPNDISKFAYIQADAMLKAREAS